MIKRFLVFSIYFLLINGCSPNIKTVDSNLSIEDFSMTKFDNNGDKLYSIISPKSILIRDEQIYKLEKTEIILYKQNKLNYIINSDKSSLLNNTKYIKLEGGIRLYDMNNTANIITASNAYWNIVESKFLLVGNVILKNSSIYLASSKAVLNKNDNIVKFFKPVKYKYISNSSNLNYKLKADNAYYDLDRKKLLFDSKNERIKSKISF